MVAPRLEAAIRDSSVLVHPGSYDVVRLAPDVELDGRRAFAVMRDAAETTVVARPEHLRGIDVLDREAEFALIEARVDNPFETAGFAAALLGAIASVGIGLLSVSTFSIDYVLVRTRDLEPALDALVARGFRVVRDG